MELRSTSRQKEKATISRAAAALAGKRKLDYDEVDDARELGFEPMKIRPRPCASKVKRSRGDNRLSQSITNVSLGVVDGLMSDIIGSDSDDDESTQHPTCDLPDNCFGGTITAGINLFRCNVQTSFLELDTLQFTQKHYRMLRKTPFWFFLKAMKEVYPLERFRGMCMKSEEALRRILVNWDKHRKCIVLAKMHGRFTRRDVQLIFGVVAGSILIPSKVPYGGEKALWLRRCFQGEMGRNFVLKKSCLLKKIRSLSFLNFQPQHHTSSPKMESTFFNYYLFFQFV